MNDRYFLDSNICIYLLDSNSTKQAISQNLLLQSTPFISTQVIAENINVCLRKLGYSKQDAFQHTTNLMTLCELLVIQDTTLYKAFQLSIQYQYSYFDSLIIAAALENQCKILYSEDMNHTQVIDNQLQIINPFKP